MRRQPSAFRNGLSRIYNTSAEEAIVAIADDARRNHLRTGPPFDVRGCATSLRVRIERGKVSGSGVLDGWSTGKPRIILPEQATTTIGRRRENFTIAHELGHLLIRTKLEGCVPAAVLARGHPDEEYFCNAFAAELLAPRGYVRRIVEKYGLTPKVVVWLSDMCDVTTRVITRRLAGVYREQFLAIRWQRRGRLPECTWSEPYSDRAFEVPRTGRSTVERALETNDEHEGWDTFLCGARRVRWRCLSQSIGSPGVVLTVGLRSGASIKLGSLGALPDQRRLLSPQMSLFGEST